MSARQRLSYAQFVAGKRSRINIMCFGSLNIFGVLTTFVGLFRYSDRLKSEVPFRVENNTSLVFDDDEAKDNDDDDGEDYLSKKIIINHFIFYNILPKV